MLYYLHECPVKDPWQQLTLTPPPFSSWLLYWAREREMQNFYRAPMFVDSQEQETGTESAAATECKQHTALVWRRHQHLERKTLFFILSRSLQIRGMRLTQWGEGRHSKRELEIMGLSMQCTSDIIWAKQNCNSRGILNKNLPSTLPLLHPQKRFSRAPNTIRSCHCSVVVWTGAVDQPDVQRNPVVTKLIVLQGWGEKAALNLTFLWASCRLNSSFRLFCRLSGRIWECSSAITAHGKKGLVDTKDWKGFRGTRRGVSEVPLHWARYVH